jgi:membrane fusion protein, multidrug efflux system
MKLCSPQLLSQIQRSALLPVLCLLLAGCLKTNSQSKDAQKKGSPAAEVPVSIAKVAQKNVPLEIQVIGNVEAYSAVSVKSQVTGPILKVNFREGDFVKKGDLLFSINASPFQAALAESQANLAKSEAQLAQSEAMLKRDMAQEKFARNQAARYSALEKEGVFSKDQSEQVESTADMATEAIRVDQAAITSAKATAVASRAAVDTANIQLGYTTIRSPIDGRTGTIPVKEGNLITANTTELLTINQVQPIYVSFAVPESNLGTIKRYDALGKLPVTAVPQDGAAHPETGLLTFIDNAVDLATGTIRLKATFPNADRLLWPGQFVRVTMRLTVQQNALVVPGQAVQEGQDGSFVYLVKPDMSVESRPVKTGTRLDQEVVIESGLEDGDSVVTEGQLRLAPGMHVRLRTEGYRGKKGGGEQGGPPGKKGP